MFHKLTLSEVIGESKRSLRVAMPVAISRAMVALSGFFASVMISDLGNESLGAHSLVWNIYTACLVFFAGVLYSIGILISQSYGAGDKRSIKISFVRGIMLTIISTPIMMLVMWFCPTILVWTGKDPQIIKLARFAFHSLMWATLPFGFMAVTRQFFVGVNKAYLITVMSIISIPIEFFFFYVFIFGKFGLPQLGLRGVGYGLTISYSLIAVSFMSYIYFAKQFKKYMVLKKCWHVDLKILFELLRVGLPLGFLYIMEMGLFAVIPIMMGWLGTDILAAYQISYQYFIFALMVSFGLVQSTAVRVGVEVGKNNRRAVRLTAMINMVIGFLLAIGFCIAFTYFPKIAIGLNVDVNSPHTQKLVNRASSFLSIVGILILIDSLRLVSIGALRGLKDTKMPMLISFIGFWCIAFPTAYLLGFQFKLGGVGILYGIIIGISFSGFITLFRFNRISKRINLESLVTKAEKQKAA